MSWFIAQEIPLAPRTRFYLRLGQAGFMLLFLLMPLWVLWLNPPKMGSQMVLLALLWGPLWLPLLGILRGKAYTFAWANFIVMWYFLHSLTTLWVGEGLNVVLAAVELAAASLMFYGCTYYAKYRGQELGLKIPKLKDDLERS